MQLCYRDDQEGSMTTVPYGTPHQMSAQTAYAHVEQTDPQEMDVQQPKSHDGKLPLGPAPSNCESSEDFRESPVIIQQYIVPQGQQNMTTKHGHNCSSSSTWRPQNQDVPVHQPSTQIGLISKKHQQAPASISSSFYSPENNKKETAV